jgi:dolichyl-phosphate beta-glucosyltransferase
MAPPTDDEVARSERRAQSAPAPSLSVVVPAYNEASRIEASLGGTLRFLGGLLRSWELIVVDDGSQDGTAVRVEALRRSHPEAPLRVVRLPRNQGKGAALRAGVAVSTGTRVLTMDADLATPLDELHALEARLPSGGVAIGSRALPGADIRRSQSWRRVLLGRAGNLWIQALALPGLQDTQCGFKLFDGAVARRVFAQSVECRFGIDIEVLALARRLEGAPVVEVPVTWAHQEGSKVRWHDYVDVLVQVPRIAWSVRRRSRGVRGRGGRSDGR